MTDGITFKFDEKQFQALQVKLDACGNMLTSDEVVGVVEKALQPAKRKAQSDIKSDTGSLKASVDTTVKLYPSKKTIWGAIGIRSNSSYITEKGIRKPNKYYFIVERGRKSWAERFKAISEKAQKKALNTIRRQMKTTAQTLTDRWNARHGGAFHYVERQDILGRMRVRREINQDKYSARANYVNKAMERINANRNKPQSIYDQIMHKKVSKMYFNNKDVAATAHPFIGTAFDGLQSAILNILATELDKKLTEKLGGQAA